MQKNINYNEYIQLLEEYINMPQSIVSTAIHMLPSVNNTAETRFIVQADEKTGNLKIITSEIIGEDSLNYNYLISVNEATNEYNIFGECKHTDLYNGKIKNYYCDNVEIKHTELGFNNNPGYVINDVHRITRTDNSEPTTLHDEKIDKTKFFDEKGIEVFAKYDIKKYAKREGQYAFNFGLAQPNFNYINENIYITMNRDDMAHAIMRSDIYDGNNVLKGTEEKYCQIDENKNEMAVVGYISEKEYEQDRELYNKNKANNTTRRM